MPVAWLLAALTVGARLRALTAVPLSFFEESLLDPASENALRATGADDVLSALLPNVTFKHIRTDVGVAQLDGLRVDVAGTLRMLDDFWRAFDSTAAALVDVAQLADVHAVVFDISALGPVVAQKLGVPSIGISNFSWDFIYDELARTTANAAFRDYADRHRAAYRLTTRFIYLPGRH